MMMTSSTPVGRDVAEFTSWHHKGDFGDGNSGNGGGVPAGENRNDVVLDRRPSVRDLANIFEKEAQAAAAKKKAMEAELQLSGEEQFQLLKQILLEFQGRFGGRNKEDAERALKKAELLEALYIQREAELTQRQWAVKNLVLLLKEVATDAKVMIEDVRSVSLAEISAAQELATKLQSVLQKQDLKWKERVEMSTAAHRKELDDLRKESHEARRIQMLHESSRYMDLERELNRLKKQLDEKTAESVTLRKEVDRYQEEELKVRQEKAKTAWYVLNGDSYLGSLLSIAPVSDSVTDLAHCTIHWYRVKDETTKELLYGAVSPQYAPEPADVGSSLRALVIMPGGQTQTLQSSGPIEDARGLSKYVETLFNKGGAAFNVKIAFKNGENVEKHSVYFFDINRSRMKLHKTHGVKSKEVFTHATQLCGARVSGVSAPRGLFWSPRKDENYMLIMESEKERNAAIMLARKFARLQNIELRGPSGKPQ